MLNRLKCIHTISKFNNYNSLTCCTNYKLITHNNYSYYLVRFMSSISCSINNSNLSNNHTKKSIHTNIDSDNLSANNNNTYVAINKYNNLNRVYLSLGSNIGDRHANIQSALKRLANIHNSENNNQLIISNTSFLYETSPLYITEQPLFLNIAAEIYTNLTPVQLLNACKSIEADLGRDFNVVRNSPRTIDIDILFYSDKIINNHSPKLIIPHIAIPERGFVLKPLLDIIDNNFKHPIHNVTINNLYDQWLNSSTANSSSKKLFNTNNPCSNEYHNREITINNSFEQLYRVLPLVHRVIGYDRRTFIMQILNITPDSFSQDGKLSSNQSQTQIVQSAIDCWRNGADIIDIGGESTRPGAELIDVKTELNRVIPIIKAIHEHEPHLAISIDTYHSETAEAAIAAGAHIVNDISGGLFDRNMFKTVAKLGVPYILMHTRGAPNTMHQPQFTQYNNLIGDIKQELQSRINEAINNGIYRWNIIADPGIGFSKTPEQNVEIIRNLSIIRPFNNIPLLLGPSRKGFIKKILESKDPGRQTNIELRDRVAGTAATITAAIQQGVEFVRVHDIETMRSVCRVSDAIYRGWKMPKLDSYMEPNSPHHQSNHNANHNHDHNHNPHSQ